MIDLQKIVALKYFDKMIDELKNLGFFDSTQNDELKKASLVDIAHGKIVSEVEKTFWHKWHRYQINASIITEVKGLENYTFVWLERTPYNLSDDNPCGIALYAKNNDGGEL